MRRAGCRQEALVLLLRYARTFRPANRYNVKTNPLLAMKLRLTERDVRLRLEAEDLETLRRTGRVELVTPFDAQTAFTCTLRIDAQTAVPVAHLDGSHLTVLLPTEEARRWLDSDQIGIEARQAAGPNRTLKLLIEKDIGCQHKPQARPSDVAAER